MEEKLTGIERLLELHNILCYLYSFCDRIGNIERDLDEIKKSESYKKLDLDENEFFANFRLADARHIIFDYCRRLQTEYKKLLDKYKNKELNRKKKRHFKVTIEEKTE